MRTVLPSKLEEGRTRDGPMGSTFDEAGAAGAFVIMGPTGGQLRIISSGPDSEFGWEHVSISLPHRTPNWTEMCFVKDLFWREDECVLQYHPPKSDYINTHPNCLHLWRPLDGVIPMPPLYLV